MGQRVSNYIERTLTVDDRDGQFIHPLQPARLAPTQVRLRLQVLPRLMISINTSRYPIYVTAPFYTCQVDCQEFFVPRAIITFSWRVLAAVVRNWVQPIVVLLQQYGASGVLTCIRINYKWFTKIWQTEYGWVT